MAEKLRALAGAISRRACFLQCGERDGSGPQCGALIGGGSRAPCIDLGRLGSFKDDRGVVFFFLPFVRLKGVEDGLGVGGGITVRNRFLTFPSRPSAALHL